MAVLLQHFRLAVKAARLELVGPRYNIAPTQEVAAIRSDPTSGAPQWVWLRWGLVPSWSKEPAGGPPLINARGETIADKPSFRTAFRRRRCLIPADGFYEWQAAGAGRAAAAKKQPFFIHYRDERPFAFAGLWETWTGAPATAPAVPDEQLTIESCAIVTTAASKYLQPIHERMPVILEPADYARWLDPQLQDAAAVLPLVAANDDPEITAEPITDHVNRVANDDPGCIAVERSLFD